MAEVKLFKKSSVYTDKTDGKEKTAINFYVQCGNAYVPVEIKYFADKDTGVDNRYRERKVLMTAFAEDFPEKTASKKDTA